MPARSPRQTPGSPALPSPFWGCPRHAPPGGREVFRRQFGEADQLIASCISGVAVRKERDVRVVGACGGNLDKLIPQDLRTGEAHDPAPGVELPTKPLA